MLLTEETKKNVKNLNEAESEVRRQGAELSNRDGTIAKLTDQLYKVTRDSIKKSTKIDDLRNQRTGLRNKLDEQAALLQTAVDERDSELDNLRALLSISTDYILKLEANMRDSSYGTMRLNSQQRGDGSHVPTDSSASRGPGVEKT